MTTPDDTTGKRANDMPQDIWRTAHAVFSESITEGAGAIARALLAERERCARARNAHDALISALEQALDRMEQTQGWAADGLVKAGHVPQMDAAIAAAKEILAKVSTP